VGACAGLAINQAELAEIIDNEADVGATAYPR
jgi:hypothetical protein